MKRVLKYPIPIDGQWHDVPGPHFDSVWSLPVWHVGIQNGVVMLWMIPANHTGTVRLKVVATGQQFDPKHRHIGTVQDFSNGLVWHLIHENGSAE